jgi:DNA-directed RNA polymerase beta' subunit
MKYWTSTYTIKVTDDSIVESVINKYKKRSQVGINKYGTTMDREDLSVLDWLRHAQEEAQDLTLYLEKLIVTDNDHKQIEKIAVHKFMRALNITPSSRFEITDKDGNVKIVLVADLLNETFKE